MFRGRAKVASTHRPGVARPDVVRSAVRHAVPRIADGALQGGAGSPSWSSQKDQQLQLDRGQIAQ
jgi:hypothetical protein